MRLDVEVQYSGTFRKSSDVRQLGGGFELRMRSEGDMGRLQEWSNVATLPTGRVHVSVMPITDQDRTWVSRSWCTT